MGKDGNFGYPGVPRSYSFSLFHADRIPNSTTAVKCPDMECEQIDLQNDPTSNANIIIGGPRLAEDGFGWVLQPGESTGWIPVQNLNLIWHIEDDATTYLNYKMVR